MTLKTYEICIEKDVDITNAQAVLNMNRAGWKTYATDYINPVLVTFYKWFTVECDDIEEYEFLINTIDPSLRMIWF